MYNYSDYDYDEVIAKWSFGKDENYLISIRRKDLMDELEKRPNLKSPKKPIVLNLTCNYCKSRFRLKTKKDGKQTTFSVYKKIKSSCSPYDMLQLAISDMKASFNKETEYAEFSCPDCGEIFRVKL